MLACCTSALRFYGYFGVLLKRLSYKDMNNYAELTSAIVAIKLPHYSIDLVKCLNCEYLYRGISVNSYING